ncbi:MAG TPA: glycerol-3-phosphate 1-O-acyltransferase [Pseudonocardiaceae bacterium]
MVAFGEGPVVLLLLAGTPVERAVLQDWARAQAPDAEQVDAAGLGERLGRGDDPLVVPLRVIWLPRERGGVRRVRWSDLLLFTDPRRPRVGAQQRIVLREPDRHTVVMGEPAHENALRSRFGAETGGGGTSDRFVDFVLRQAVLAVERAERGVIGDRHKVPRLVAEQILGSGRFRRELTAYAERTGAPLDEVTAQAADRLREVVGAQSRLVNDLMAAALSPIHAKAWTPRIGGVDLAELRELNRTHSLVFLPTHRSYSDPLVLRSVLDAHDFPPNHIVGGDNMAFWPLGPLGRRAGMVFIRRSFGDDELYKLAVREYFGYLAAKRFNLEWYIEGGRSRTGKLRAPKFGILQFLVQALEAGRADDAYLVPVSITFDLLPEVGTMAAEQGGAAKKREGVGWLARYMRSHQQQLGTVHVRFGEPLALRPALEAAGGVPGAEAGARRLAMQKVAFEVCDRMNRATPVLPGTLVPLALLGVTDRALTLDEVRRVLDPLLDHVAARKLPSSGLDELRRPEGVRAVLRTLTRHGVVTTYADGTEPVYAVEPGQHLVAAYYRNNAIHWFVNRAIVELAALGEGTLDDAWRTALRLRDVFKYEFFFAEKPVFRDELMAELELLGIDPAAAATVERRRELLAGASFRAAHRVLRSFAEAYLVVADRLAARDPRTPVVTKEFLDECVAVGRQYVLQRRISGPESVSKELFESALRLAANRDLVDPGREELTGRRREFAAEMAGIVAAVAGIAELDARATGDGRAGDGSSGIGDAGDGSAGIGGDGGTGATGGGSRHDG